MPKVNKLFMWLGVLCLLGSWLCLVATLTVSKFFVVLAVAAGFFSGSALALATTIDQGE